MRVKRFRTREEVVERLVEVWAAIEDEFLCGKEEIDAHMKELEEVLSWIKDSK